MNDAAADSKRWQKLARRTVWKVNLGWWLERSMPLLIGAGVVGFAVIFWLRSQGKEVSIEGSWPWLAAAVAAPLLAGWLLARRRFIRRDQALVRLEAQLLLHNALTVAAAGRAPWPPAPRVAVKDGWQWRWTRVGGPFALTVACLAAAIWIPVLPEAAALPVVEPQAWEQMDEWLDKLNEEKVITPEEKEEQAAKIAALREQPKEKWFSHDSLQAGDTLKEQLQREIQKLGKNLSDAERSLNGLQNYAEQLSQEAKDHLLKEFDEAMKGMKGSPLQVDPKLLKELAEMDVKSLKGLSKEQLDQLRESLKKKAGACEGMCENPGFLGDSEGEDDALADMLKRFGDGEAPGQGGIGRGPGTAPLTLSDEENRFDTDKKEAVSNSDLSRAQLGSAFGIQDGKHEVDKTSAAPRAAGAVENAGQGGAQVWRESLTPEEKAVLKRVFQ
ncbi:MAG TPA: hypothetical protein VD994_13815 [Prosthecobacter sp.]|nr:hypothetical protein [Prosthecobacter sp.]